MGQKGIHDYHCLFLITFPDWYKNLLLLSHLIRYEAKTNVKTWYGFLLGLDLCPLLPCDNDIF